MDAAGKVTAVSVGSATITASAEGATSAACVVTVNPAPKKLVLQSIYGTKNDISIKVGGVAPMMVDGTDSTIQWSMENSSIASVDSKGNVKGLRNGKTKVIATVDGQTLTCIHCPRPLCCTNQASVYEHKNREPPTPSQGRKLPVI